METYSTQLNYLEKGCKCLSEGNWKLAVKYWEAGLKETLFTPNNPMLYGQGNFIKEQDGDAVGKYAGGILEKHILKNGKELADNRVERFKPLIDGVYSLNAYRSLYDSEAGDPLSALLRCMKNSKEKAPVIGYALGRTLLDFLTDKQVMNKIDVIIPVPIFPGKLKERGYNQSDLLAIPFQWYTKIPVKREVLSRIKDTKDLRSLSQAKREQELKGAFKVNEPDFVMGESILLIDDVITYGTTLKECARALRKYGAEKIYAATIAKSESSTLRERQKYHGIDILSGVSEEESEFRRDDYLGNLEDFIRVYREKNAKPKTLNSVTTS